MSDTRERLIEIIEKSIREDCCCYEITASAGCMARDAADAIIAAGVLLPRFKVGQTVFTIIEKRIRRHVEREIYKGEIEEVFYNNKTKRYGYFLKNQLCGFDTDFYATATEAQAALDKLRGE